MEKLSSAIGSIDLSEVHDGPLMLKGGLASIGGKIWDFILDSLPEIDLSSMTKEQFLQQVDAIYDTYVAPQVVSIGYMGIFANIALNAIVLALAAKYYDNHS